MAQTKQQKKETTGQQNAEPVVTIPTIKLTKKTKKRNIAKSKNNQAREDDSQVYEIMERKDEQQIVAELEGRYLEEFVYEFPQDGKLVTGLSWLGVQEASRSLGGIDVEILEQKEGETDSIRWIEFVVKATDVYTGSSRMGIKRQYAKGRRRNGTVYDIPFYTEIALSKAQRNAIRALIPQTLIKAWIQAHRAGASNKDVQAGQAMIDQTVQSRSQAQAFQCTDCQAGINQAIVTYSEKNFGSALCMTCQRKYKKRG